MTTYSCERAWLPPGRVAAEVEVVVEDGGITTVREGQPAGTGERLAGLVLPGLANVHSHAFHRALRGRTHSGRGSFWTWREQMYAVAAALDPDAYLELARAVYGEMALAGVTCVGEFHYLHHAPGGGRYDDPNTMGHVLVQAAREAGLRMTLLDTCYLTGGIGRPLEGTQLRFGDGDASAWCERVDALHAAYADADDVLVGAALHSVRGVPPDAMPAVVAWARHRDRPLHVHLSEQRAENQACLDAFGVTPTRLLHANDALGHRTTAVHATHLTDDDLTLIGRSRTGVCMCPTTERDLADGIGPARRLHDAGATISLGSDSHAVIDLFEEARGLELDERLATQVRGHWSVAELLDAVTVSGHAALGRPDAGQVAPGAAADLVAVRLDSPRTAGARGAETGAVVFAATAADVTDVVSAGRRVVRAGRHELLGDVGHRLDAAITAATRQ